MTFMRPKQLSGKEIVKIFERHGFAVKRTLGSHVRMTYSERDFTFHITIPLHNPLKKSTLHGIIKDFESCFGRQKAEEVFFNK